MIRIGSFVQVVFVVVVIAADRITSTAIVTTVVRVWRKSARRINRRRHEFSKMFVSLLPPGIGGEGYVVVDRMVRAVDIVASVRINASVGTADNAVVATVGAGVIISLIPWQRQGRQSIGSFHSFSATVVATATMIADDVADNVAAIYDAVALKQKTTLVVDGIPNSIAVPVAFSIIDRLCLRTKTLRCYS